MKRAEVRLAGGGKGWGEADRMRQARVNRAGLSGRNEEGKREAGRVIRAEVLMAEVRCQQEWDRQGEWAGMRRAEGHRKE